MQDPLSNSQVRTTNTNVDNGVDLLARVSLPFAASDLVGELLHVLIDAAHLLHHALAVDLHRQFGDIAESNVVDGAVLGEVDGLTLEHLVTEALEVGLFGQRNEVCECVLGDEVLGKVEQDFGIVGGVVETT